MTTDIDYTTEFISLRPDEETRSIAELCEEERLNGYSGMTDVEISNLIAYKEHCAIQTAIIQEMKAHNEAIQKQMQEDAEKQREQSREFFDKILNAQPALVSVTGNEVE